MLFNSLSFLVFFPVVVCIYYALASRFRPFFLLLASCVFYMAFVPKYVFILFFLITADYFLGQAIERRSGRDRKILLILSLVTNLGTLFFFKYFNFFSENIASLANLLHWNYSPALISILVPLGLSFHVFQSLSYVIEVYRGKYKAERNFIHYAVYVMFFPQLVAGPIERPQNLLPQFKLEHNFDAYRVRRGLERMLWGFFKKLVIADQIAAIINPIFLNLPPPNALVTPLDGPSLVVLLALFSYQLYCDFSGYSDIAIGSAKVLGFDLMENFNRPFSATSIADYWRRWHISLSSWLRDYLYYPLALGWGKVSRVRLYLSLFVTFTLIGFWHGANWTFVLMGAIFGIYLVFGSITEKIRERFAEIIGLTKAPKLRRAIKILIVFILVSLGNIFFRVENLRQAWYILAHLSDNLVNIFNYHYVRYALFRGSGLWKDKVIIVVFFSVILMEVFQYYQTKRGGTYLFDEKSKPVRYAWYYALILIILFFGYFGAQTFIYFKF